MTDDYNYISVHNLSKPPPVDARYEEPLPQLIQFVPGWIFIYFLKPHLFVASRLGCTGATWEGGLVRRQHASMVGEGDGAGHTDHGVRNLGGAAFFNAELLALL